VAADDDDDDGDGGGSCAPLLPLAKLPLPLRWCAGVKGTWAGDVILLRGGCEADDSHDEPDEKLGPDDEGAGAAVCGGDAMSVLWTPLPPFAALV
jgi:hypothetical protein